MTYMLFTLLQWLGPWLAAPVITRALRPPKPPKPQRDVVFRARGVFVRF